MYKMYSTIVLSLLIAAPATAMVTGQCAGCHTMHNSQNGISVTGGNPNPTLLVNSCVGCHSGTSSTYTLGTSTVPVVNHTGSAPLDYLAGGSFYWVAQGDDNKGHNVLGISNQDATLAAAPGNNYSCAGSCHMSLATAPSGGSSGMAGGCQGCHLAPAHHADDSANVVGETGGYYRFLSGHMSGDGHGVEGIEDSDWQLTKGATDHNEYLGNVTSYINSDSMYSSHTTTAFCCGCHGGFHEQQNGNNAWIRHPSDAVIPSTGEYAAYVSYDPLAPVARPDLTISAYNAGPTDIVTPGTDLVMCLSCHRPHGGPYSDLLRWDYSLMDAGTTGIGQNTGCFVCHTNKDG